MRLALALNSSDHKKYMHIAIWRFFTSGGIVHQPFKLKNGNVGKVQTGDGKALIFSTHCTIFVNTLTH